MQVVDPLTIHVLSDWIGGFDLQFFVTLNPHRTWTIERLQHEVHQTLRRVNEFCAGKFWYKKRSRYLLPRGFFFIETSEDGYHAHLLVAFDIATLQQARDVFELAWNERAPSGTCDVQTINLADPLGLYSYTTKEIWKEPIYEAWQPFSHKPTEKPRLLRFIRGFREDVWKAMQEPTFTSLVRK